MLHLNFNSKASLLIIYIFSIFPFTLLDISIFVDLNAQAMASAVAPLAHEIIHCVVLAEDESTVSVIVAVSPFSLVDISITPLHSTNPMFFFWPTIVTHLPIISPSIFKDFFINGNPFIDFKCIITHIFCKCKWSILLPDSKSCSVCYCWS